MFGSDYKSKFRETFEEALANKGTDILLADSYSALKRERVE